MSNDRSDSSDGNDDFTFDVEPSVTTDDDGLPVGARMAPDTHSQAPDRQSPKPDNGRTSVSGGGSTVFDALARDFQQQQQDKNVTLPVMERDGYEVVYNKMVDYDDLQLWMQSCRTRQGINELKMSCIVLGNQCIGIKRHGEMLVHDGQSVTFRTPEFKRIFTGGDGQVPSAIDTVKRFYGLDGHVLQTARYLMREAGYSADDLMDTNPTKS